MTILADEYNTALREIRSLRLQLKDEKQHSRELSGALENSLSDVRGLLDDVRSLRSERDAWREKAEKAQQDADLLSEDLDGAKAELQALRDSSWLVQERDAARAEAAALQEELGRVRAERDRAIGWQIPCECGCPGSVLSQYIQTGDRDVRDVHKNKRYAYERHGEKVHFYTTWRSGILLPGQRIHYMLPREAAQKILGVRYDNGSLVAIGGDTP